MPAGGSPETWNLVAKMNYAYAYLTFGSIQKLDKLNAGFWATMKEHGREPNPFALGASMFILVGDSLKECEDRKSTRLNSSHANISYAVFCLKKKKTDK